MMMTKEEIEAICMEMISLTGEGRALVHESLEAFAANDLELSREKLEAAQVYLTKAHEIQFSKIIKAQAQGESLPFHVLLIHAMDLLMVSTSERDVAQKLLTGAETRRE